MRTERLKPTARFFIEGVLISIDNSVIKNLFSVRLGEINRMIKCQNNVK